MSSKNVVSRLAERPIDSKIRRLHAFSLGSYDRTYYGSAVPEDEGRSSAIYYGTMTVSAEIDRENRVVHTTASGLLTKAEFIAHIESTWRDPSIASYDEIVDARQADVSQLSAADLSAIVNSGVVYDPDCEPRLALCVDSELAFGLARMFGTMRETHVENARQVRVFRDVESAQAWLAR